MLKHRRFPASLSMVSLDLPVRSAVETIVTLYQRAPQRFHVLIDVPAPVADHPGLAASAPVTPAHAMPTSSKVGRSASAIEAQNRLLWLEIHPSRAIFTSQSKTGLSYRHMWERGTYGISRYWLNHSSPADFTGLTPTSQPSNSLNPLNPPQQTDEPPSLRMRLRNFTRSFELTGRDYPEHLRLEYELWSQQLKFGTYVLDLDIHH